MAKTHCITFVPVFCYSVSFDFDRYSPIVLSSGEDYFKVTIGIFEDYREHFDSCIYWKAEIKG
jgi:hypothetical protein